MTEEQTNDAVQTGASIVAPDASVIAAPVDAPTVTVAKSDALDRDGAATRIQALARGRAARQAQNGKSDTASAGATGVAASVAPPQAQSDSAVITIQEADAGGATAATSQPSSEATLPPSVDSSSGLSEEEAEAEQSKHATQTDITTTNTQPNPNPAVPTVTDPTSTPAASIPYSTATALDRDAAAAKIQALARGHATRGKFPRGRDRASQVSSDFLDLPASPSSASVSRFSNSGVDVASDAARSRPSSAGVSHSGGRRESMVGVASKASDLLFGGSKSSDDKRLDVLGISEKQMELFDTTPKAFNVLGASTILGNVGRRVSVTGTEAVTPESLAKDERDALDAGERAKQQAEKDERRASLPQPIAVEDAKPLVRPTPMGGKAAQVLLGLHKSDLSPLPSSPGGLSPSPTDELESARSSRKIYDKLGVTPKQLEMFPNSQSKAFVKLGVDVPLQASMLTTANPHHLLHVREDAIAIEAGQAAAQAEFEVQDEKAHCAKKQVSRKVHDLTVGGHKKSKVLDKLGVSEMEMKLFQQNQVAYKKLGIFSDDQRSPQLRADSPTVIPSTVLLNPVEPPPPPEPWVDPATVKPASNVTLGKAQGILVGVRKGAQGPGEKEQVTLGISKKERASFSGPSGQKAYQKLGVFDTPAMAAARRSAAEDGPRSARHMQQLQLQNQAAAQAALAQQHGGGPTRSVLGSTPLALAQQQQLHALQASRRAALANGNSSLSNSRSTPTLPRSMHTVTASSLPPSTSASTSALIGMRSGQLAPLPSIERPNAGGGYFGAGGGGGGVNRSLSPPSKWGRMKNQVTGGGGMRGPGSLAAAAKAAAQGGVSYSSSLAAFRHHDPNHPNNRISPLPHAAPAAAPAASVDRHRAASVFTVALAANRAVVGARPKAVAALSKQLVHDIGFGIQGAAIGIAPANNGASPKQLSRSSSGERSTAHSRNVSRSVKRSFDADATTDANSSPSSRTTGLDRKRNQRSIGGTSTDLTEFPVDTLAAALNDIPHANATTNGAATQ